MNHRLVAALIKTVGITWEDVEKDEEKRKKQKEAQRKSFFKRNFEIVEYDKNLFRGLRNKREPSKEKPTPGFYGLGAYFMPIDFVTDMWGDYVYEYKTKIPLRLGKHIKSFKGSRPKRTDWLESIPDDLDGVWLGPGAEGENQIILRDFNLVKTPKNVSPDRLKKLWPK
jgi:hypothetical protein